MNYTKSIICLANSRKLNGKCIAGLEFEDRQVGGWIRPVSNRSNGEIVAFDCPMENGAEPNLLDILRIPMVEPRPNGFQTENHLIDNGYYWVKEGFFAKQYLPHYCKEPNPLWVNEFHSTNGFNDRIPEMRASRLTNSLVLIEPQQLTITVVPGYNRGQLKTRAEFSVAGEIYCLVVTDPAIENQYRPYGVGRYTFPSRPIACISIGEPYRGFCYKLVASIISL